MNDTETRTEYEVLKQRLLSVGVPIPGTIHELYARCGSKTCPCATDDTQRHGPYLRWHHKTRGRQNAVGINEVSKTFIARGIKNREEIERLFDKMLEFGATQAEGLSVNLKKSTKNSKKS
jgi:hypothetical protein